MPINQSTGLFDGYYSNLWLVMTNFKYMRANKKTDHWGNRLKAVLKEKGISARKASTLAGVSHSVLDSWTSGATPKDLHAVKKLADSLQISFSWLLIGEHESGNHKPTMAEFFSETPYFDGYAHIRIDRLIPKREDEEN